MKKNIVLAVLLAMLTVVSAGCAMGNSADDKSSNESSASDKDNKNKSDKKTSDFSAIFGADDDSNSDDDETVDTEAPTEKKTEKSTEKTTKPATTKDDSDVATSNCLYDDNNLKIEYIDMKEEYGYLDFNLNLTNTGDIDLEIQAWETYINGIEVDAIMSASVEAGKTTIDDVGFDVEELEEKGITVDTIETLEVSFHIFDWEHTIESIDTELIKLNVGGSATSDKKDDKKDDKEDDTNFVDGNELYADNGMNIKYVDTVEEAGYLDFNLEMKNTNKVEVEVQAWETYINGIEVDAIMSSPVESGKTVTDTMGFEIEELEEKGIDPDKIESVEVSFHIFSWEDEIESVDTELIKFKP